MNQHNNKELEKLSKFLCYILRHKPKIIPSLEVDSQGWAKIDSLISKDISLEDLVAVVSYDSKGRFQILNGNIRCLYGHSLSHVNIKGERPNLIPYTLYHGTTKSAAEKILVEGLKPMGRQAVCLATSMKVAYSNGIRYAKDVEELVIFAIKNPGIMESLSQLSEEIWCVDYVPPNLLVAVNPKIVKEVHEEYSSI